MIKSDKFIGNYFNKPTLCESLFLDFFNVKSPKEILIDYLILTTSGVTFKKKVILFVQPKTSPAELCNLVFLNTAKDLFKEIIESDNLYLCDGKSDDTSMSKIWIRSSSVISVYPMVPGLDFYKLDKVTDNQKIKIIQQSPPNGVNSQDIAEHLGEYIKIKGERIKYFEEPARTDYRRSVKSRLEKLMNYNKGKLTVDILNSIKSAILALEDEELQLALDNVVKDFTSGRG